MATASCKKSNMSLRFEVENPMKYNSSREEVIPGLLNVLRSIKCDKEASSDTSREREWLGVTEEESSSDVGESDESGEMTHNFSKTHQNHKYQTSREPRDMQKVHEELKAINDTLQHENRRLKEWELELQRKETKLREIEKQVSSYTTSMKRDIEDEISKRCVDVENEYDLKMQQLQAENKKSRNSFKIIKNANEKLKAKVSEDEVKLKNYEEKQTSLQHRISNFQRKIELLTKQINDQAVEYKNCMAEKGKSVAKSVNNKVPQNPLPNMYHETFSLLLHWVADDLLKHNACSMINNKGDTELDKDVNVMLTNERILKVIIFLPNILQHTSLMNNKLQLSVVQFLYWSLLHQHFSCCPQKTSHSATYRRIGEELFQANNLKQGRENSSTQAFYRSSNYNIRTMSSLIILYSLSQADIVVHILQTLNEELKSELSKEFFLEIYGTEMLLPLLKLTNKLYLGYVVDILMVLIIDSPYMQQFLNQLSSVKWVQSIIAVLKNSADDITLMENLSLVLQRLSKQKGIKPIFDALQVKAIVSELLRAPGFEGEYLHLNLRSILLNIESMRTKNDK